MLFGNTMNLNIQIMAEIISNDGCKGNEAANVDDMDYRSKAAKMKAQDDSKFYNVNHLIDDNTLRLCIRIHVPSGVKVDR